MLNRLIGEFEIDRGERVPEYCQAVKVEVPRSSGVQLLVDKFRLAGRPGGLTAEFNNSSGCQGPYAGTLGRPLQT